MPCRAGSAPVASVVCAAGSNADGIDHTTYDTASILKFITRRFGLEPLPGVRANTGDLSAALQP